MWMITRQIICDNHMWDITWPSASWNAYAKHIPVSSTCMVSSYIIPRPTHFSMTKRPCGIVWISHGRFSQSRVHLGIFSMSSHHVTFVYVLIRKIGSEWKLVPMSTCFAGNCESASGLISAYARTCLLSPVWLSDAAQRFMSHLGLFVAFSAANMLWFIINILQLGCGIKARTHAHGRSTQSPTQQC